MAFKFKLETILENKDGISNIYQVGKFINLDTGQEINIQPELLAVFLQFIRDYEVKIRNEQNEG